MNRGIRMVAPLLLAGALAVTALAGCDGGQTGEQTDNNGSQETTESLRIGIVEQWVQSRHANVVTFAAEEDGCKNCHDGQTFSETGGGFVPRMSSNGTASAGATGSAETTQAPRDWVVATDCRVCHTAAGVEIAEQGTIDGVPSLDSAKGGMGALCMACHNGWHPPGSAEAQPLAPHHSNQTDVLFGVNTAAVANESTPSAGSAQSPHVKVTDTCVGCHVAGVRPNHRFRVTAFDGCQRDGCHNKNMTGGGDAKQDYDGDGQTEKFVAETEGLLDQLKTLIDDKAGGEVTTGQGQIQFPGGAKVDADLYGAAWNYFYFDFDASRGVHNPKHTVDTLTGTIEALGGTVGGGAGGGAQESTTTTP